MIETTKRANEVDYHLAELEIAQRHAAKLAQALELKRHEHEKCVDECDKADLALVEAHSHVTTEMRERVVEKQYTEYVEKKVRKLTTETPMPIGDWRQTAQYQQRVVNTT